MLKSEVIIFELFHFNFKFHVLLSHFKKSFLVLSHSRLVVTLSLEQKHTRCLTLNNRNIFFVPRSSHV